MRLKTIILCLLIVTSIGNTLAHEKLNTPQFSTAGFYALNDSGREVYSMNPAWRLHKGQVAGDPSKVEFDDSSWDVVNLPDGIEILPLEASGTVNYRGEVWYRKYFDTPNTIENRRMVLYFEAVMGKSKIWVNGLLAAEHFGGFTPIPIDITSLIKPEGKNVITVLADNSDDPLYPPGKPQAVLDFCYFGGIYRDVWLYTTSKDLYITDPNMVDKTAGGGFFASYRDVSERSAKIDIKLDIWSNSPKKAAKIEYELTKIDGEVVAKATRKANQGENTATIEVQNPHLWCPENPNLYLLNIRIKNTKGEIVDGMSQRIGIRTFDFSFSKGFILNGKPYPRKLIGANRHQDFALIGNALSNSLHYRDALKLKQAGMEIIRNAHYPQDPAFMDACDELGLLVIVNTPGWQFWSNDPIFEQRVYRDIRTMIRRDRNHPSVLMWEPILNETHYPEDFALNTHNIVKEETPYKGTNFTAADAGARGAKHFDIIFTHPKLGGNAEDQSDALTDSSKVYFTREWGDNVDDWNSHNSPSRVARDWGEIPQLVQAFHYAAPKYDYTSYETLQKQPSYHFGGTLWHSFDHQRGYHPDPFYGGIMDAFRRPKYSYYMFQAQAAGLIEPMVMIANELTPFSPQDVTVFSNCARVRLTTFAGGKKVHVVEKAATERWFTFPNAWDFMEDKLFSRSGKQREAYLLAEGLNENGEVIATARREPARRPSKLEIVIDTMNCPMIADGGDMAVVTARMVDRWGNVKRLNNAQVVFSVRGEGKLICTPACSATQIVWGEASALIRSTTDAGRIEVTAHLYLEGTHTPQAAKVVFHSHPAQQMMLFDPSTVWQPTKNATNNATIKDKERSVDQQKKMDEALREVERQQTSFGENPAF